MSENKWFEFVVVESITVEKRYTVRAPDEAAAREMVERGVAAKKVFVEERSVDSREIIETVRS